MLGLSNFASRQIDKKMIEEIGLPGLVLMEEAALRIYDILDFTYNLDESRVLIFAGKGNNGGDGLALARFLANRNIAVRVILSEVKGLSNEASIQLQVLRGMGIVVEEYYVGMDFNYPDIVVDALLGTGFNGELKGKVRNIVDDINSISGFKVSIDIPTGLNGDTGAGEVFVLDSHTIALGYLKKGHILEDKIKKLDLVKLEFFRGIEESIKEEDKFRYIMPFEVGDMLISRDKDTHKGSFGKIGILGGSRNMEGASILTGIGALKAGSGLVTLWLERLEDLPSRPPELMLEKWSDFLNKEIDVLVIGPGLGKNITFDINRVLKEFKGIVLIDADGLSLLAKGVINRNLISGDLILTPHPKEMKGLIGEFTNREVAVRELASRYRAVAIIKGYRTLISDGSSLWINLTGNPGMATAGSGDVLSGVIASLKGQGLSTIKSVALGVYLHGFSGDLGSEDLGELSLLASDIGNYLPLAINKLKEEEKQIDIIEVF